MKESVSTFKAAIQHRGFALVDDLSPCVTFNKVNTYAWYRQNIRKLSEEGYDPTDRKRAMELLTTSQDIPVGIIYQAPSPPPPYEELVLKKADEPPVFQDITPQRWDYESILNEFR